MIKNIGILTGLLTIAFVFWYFIGDVIFLYLVNFGMKILTMFSENIRTEVLGDKIVLFYKDILESRQAEFRIEKSVMNMSIPFYIMLAWQIYVYLKLKSKDAIKVLWQNLGIIYLVSLLFTFTIFWYTRSKTIEVMYETMSHNFGVISLILIIKDIIVLRVFGRSQKT